MIARAALLQAALVAVALGLAWQAGAQTRPGEPGPTSELIGAEGSFRLKPDGVDWERYEAPRGFGVRCPEAACGADRVYCMIQQRAAPDAKAGVAPAAALGEDFGAGVVGKTHKSLRMDYVERFAAKSLDYVERFAAKSFGQNPGLWAEFKAEGDQPPSRLGVFLLAANGYFAAVQCVSPITRYDETKPKIEALLARIEVTK